ncbi:MAG: citrate/2-methylcitrate synthase [Hyphomicrobiaceae bacterium]
MSAIESIVASVLNIGADRLSGDLAYQSIPEWDSFAHVQLMLALENRLGIVVSNDLMLELNSLAAIKDYVASVRSTLPSTPAPAPVIASIPVCMPRATKPLGIHRGLSGVTFDHSRITQIDAENGRLAYRGYNVNDLATHASFEETIALLLDGELPDRPRLEYYSRELASLRNVPTSSLELLGAMKFAHPMDALRTAVSALSSQKTDENNKLSVADAGLSLIARVPTLIAAHHALRSNRNPTSPNPMLPHAQDFLRMLLGYDPTPELSRLIDQDLIVHADHSSNASAFAARVAIGSGADVYGAITAGLAVFSGPLHGGAVEAALHQIDVIGSPERAADYVRERLRLNLPVMGFGHRVYRGEDPRVQHFRDTARQMSERAKDTAAFATVEALVAAMQPSLRLGIGPNVDLYAGLVYRLMGLPDDLACAIFAAGRMPGFVAHILEQHANNILIRPLLHYTGPSHRTLIPLQQRQTTASIGV